MKNKLLIILLAVVLSVGCSIRELTTYDSSTYVNFVKTWTDSTNISFMYYPGQDAIQWPLELELVGLAPANDAQYRIIVDTDHSTVSSANYSLPAKMTWEAGKYSQTAYITLKSTPDLYTKNLRLVLYIEATDEIGVGKVEKTTAIIWLTNSVSRPAWWTDSNDFGYMWLGDYSNEKYRLLIEVTGVYDFSELTDSELREHFLIFKKYLKDNPSYDENGQLITIPVAGLD